MTDHTRRAFASCLLLCAVAGRAVAQEPTPVPAANKVPVVLDGRILFEVGESGTWSPQERAKEINRILRAAAVDPEPVNLVLAEHEGYPTVRMGEWHLLTVTESDALPGMEPGEQAQRWLQTVETALLRAREERSAAYLTGAWLRVAAAVALAALLHWLLGRISRRLPARLARRRAIHAPPVVHKPAWQLALEIICVILQVVTWIAALRYVAERFPVSRQWRYDAAALLGTSLRAPLFHMNERAYSAFDLLWVVGAFAALWIAVNMLTRAISTRLMHATGATRGTLQPVATLLEYGLVFVGLIVILQVAGLNLSSLAIFASVLGVGIGFGLQSIANNFVSGVILSFERPIKPGDFVSVGTLKGTVLSIGARSTIIRTPDRVSIIVPNARLLENEVVNWSYGDEMARLHLPVSVVSDSDLTAVRATLLEAARSHPAVLAEPRSEVRFLGFGDGSFNLELLVWSNDPAGQALLQSELYYRIEGNLRRAGIVIPQGTLQVTAADLGAAAAPRREPPAPRVEPEPSHGAAPPDAASETVDIEALVAHMRSPDGLAIQDRRHFLGVYRKCFVGSDAVAWLMRVHDLTRDQAVRLGQSLVQRGVFHHVLDEHPFRDGAYFYRFYADEG